MEHRSRRRRLGRAKADSTREELKKKKKKKKSSHEADSVITRPQQKPSINGL
jgi:hypothetical protein